MPAHDPELILFGDAHRDQHILTALRVSRPQRRLVAAAMFERRATDHAAAAVPHEVVSAKLAQDPALRFRPVRQGHHAPVGIDDCKPGVDEAHIVAAIAQSLHLQRDLVRMPEVVRVDRGKEITARQRGALIPCGGEACVALMEEPHA